MRLATTLLNSVANQGAVFRSLRFRSSANAYLSRTPASSGNRQTWTYSAWIKRGSVTAEGTLISGGSSTGRLGVFFNASGQLISDVGGTGTYDQSAAVFLDPGAWYHFVWAFDTTQATAANRSRMYINGSQITLTQTRTFSQNTNYNINSADLQTIGVLSNSLSAYLYDGYITEVNFIDGQALTPSSFGRTNQQTGVWEPSYFKGTFGTNGYYLPFTNTTSTTTLGYDLSGNSNNWTTNNFSLTSGATYDSITDVPTLSNNVSSNYSVLNPLNKSTSATAIDGNLNANLGSSNWLAIASTMPFTAGAKYYCEFTVQQQQGIDYKGIGIVLNNTDLTGYSGAAGSRSYEWVFFGHTSSVYNNNSEVVTGLSTYGVGDTIMFAFDYSSGYWWIGKNGTWYKSGNPATGSNPTLTGLNNSVGYTPFAVGYGGSTPAIWNMNYGQRPFAYTPPEGFKTLNTYNLSNSAIVQGGQQMSATLYTGNSGSGNNSVATGFAPDLSWLKSRTQGYGNYLFDTIRGNNKYLISNNTDTQGTEGGQSFTSTGFNLNTTGGSAINEAGQGTNNMISWNWKGGGSTVSNTNGSITSQVSVNPTAGFSLVQYIVPGAGSSYTWGHGLPAAPQFIIIKGGYTTTTYNWDVYHASIGPTVRLVLNSTSGQQTYSEPWNNTAPTSTVVSQQTAWYGPGDTNIAYCWTPVAGFSQFGSYTGNGSQDGPFIYTGFRPKFFLIKRTDAARNWYIYDTSRDPFNSASSLELEPNLSSTEAASTSGGFNILSNGVKIRTNWSNYNESTATYVYAAFAENPFKNALAR